MKDDLEVYCPECGRLFKGEKKMLKHLDKQHVSNKEHCTELIIEVDARYLGGHSAFTHQTDGYLYLYSDPQNKVVFESDEFTFEIPISKIKSAKVATEKEVDAMRFLLVGIFALGWQKENKMFLIQFEDELEKMQTVVFDHSDYMTDFANELFNLSSKPREVSNSEPLAMLKLRLAKGEITVAQYEELRKIIEST
jgi:hypothetical protein